jgi:hypothetical protein
MRRVVELTVEVVQVGEQIDGEVPSSRFGRRRRLQLPEQCSRVRGVQLLGDSPW